MHTAQVRFGAVNPFSLSWFSFSYTPAMFAASALIVVFFYWGWDVTANLAEETADGHVHAGNGGFFSVFITIAYYIGFTLAALFLFSIKDAKSFNANIIYNIAVASGLGRTGGLLASFAVMLSSVATLETTMLQFSRTLFAMGRDGAMNPMFGIVDKRTQTPVRAMIVLIGVGLLLLWGSSLMPTVGTIIADSVNAVGVLVAYYFGLAGLVAAWEFRGEWKKSFLSGLWLCAYPALSALMLVVLGFYAIATFDLITKIVGIGGLAAGIVFFRPKRFRRRTGAGDRLGQVTDGAVRLLDGDVGVRAHAGIRVGDGDAAEFLAGDQVRRVIGVVADVAQRVVFRRVTVRPAVDRDALDVVLGIEAALVQCAAELVADIALERFERRCQHLRAPGLVLLALGEPRLRGRAGHADEDWLVRRTHAFVCADVHRRIQAGSTRNTIPARIPTISSESRMRSSSSARRWYRPAAS